MTTKSSDSPRTAAAPSPVPRAGRNSAPAPSVVTALNAVAGGAREAVSHNEHLRDWMHEGLHDLPADSAILAVGCEETFLAPQLSRYSSDVTVLDSSADQMAQLARRFPEIAFLPHQPSNALPFAHDTFDAIWCCEFLDRVFNPAAALREMHRVLAPGGRLLITVPDHGAVRNVLIALFKWEDHFSPSNPRIRHFTRTSLATLVREAGFGEIATAKGGTVRRIAGELVPRSLLLRAKKGPGLQLSAAASRARAAKRDPQLGRDLAFAGRSRAA